MKKGKLSGFETGDVVRTRIPTWQHTKSMQLRAGIVGFLGACDRIQSGQEVWGLWVGSAMFCVLHSQIERCFGPVQRLNCLTLDWEW